MEQLMTVDTEETSFSIRKFEEVVINKQQK
jgi:hypothetical protein